MPKKLGDIREKALLITRRILNEQGYDALTMREVAQGCGVAVGTMYNYFPSKEYLTGCVVLEDWLAAYEEMTSAAGSAYTLDAGLSQIYEKMCRFVESHQYLTSFDQRTASADFSYDKMHVRLRRQIEQLLNLLLSHFECTAEEATVVFLAESILNCSVKKFEYPQISSAFMKLLS